MIYFLAYSDVQMFSIWKKSCWLTFCCHRTSKNTVEGLKVWNQHCLPFSFPLLRRRPYILIHQNAGDILPVLNRIGRVLKCLVALVCHQIKSYFELSPFCECNLEHTDAYCSWQLLAICLFLCVKPTPLGDLFWGWSWSLFIVMG